MNTLKKIIDLRFFISFVPLTKIYTIDNHKIKDSQNNWSYRFNSNCNIIVTSCWVKQKISMNNYN